MKPVLMIGIEIPSQLHDDLAATYDVRYAPGPELWDALIDRDGPAIKAVLTNGSFGLPARLIAALPALELICCRGAGHENVDMAAASARGIVVTHGPATNDNSVADHALALLFASVRGIPAADAGARAGGWSMLRSPRGELNGKRLGILGLGTIGLKIARRAAGFDMDISYHNRRPRPDVPYTYMPSTQAMAAQSDFLIIVCPGGAATRHLVNAEVLTALGPDGFVVNVGRGTVIDTPALIAALRAGRIGGAALDVFENEPGVPEALRDVPNLIVTPHMAGRSPESIVASAALLKENLRLHFAGEPVRTPVAA